MVLHKRINARAQRLEISDNLEKMKQKVACAVNTDENRTINLNTNTNTNSNIKSISQPSSW